jgi:hypothetical protein
METFWLLDKSTNAGGGGGGGGDRRTTTVNQKTNQQSSMKKKIEQVPTKLSEPDASESLQSIRSVGDEKPVDNYSDILDSDDA